MFKFSIPVGAVLSVKSAAGGEQLMVHAGGGTFLSNLPPLMMPGYGEASTDQLKVEWASITLEQAPPVTYAFDAVSAANAVKAAAEAGDVEAGLVLKRMQSVAEVIDKPSGLILPPGHA